MPVMGGSSAIVALKAINPNVRIIASSGLKANRRDVEVPHFLPKPYVTETLLKTLVQALAN